MSKKDEFVFLYERLSLLGFFVVFVSIILALKNFQDPKEVGLAIGFGLFGLLYVLLLKMVARILMPNIVQMFKYQVLKLPVKNFKLKTPNKISVKSESGSLQIKEINIPWIKLFNMESYHSGDYNLFWLNIR